ncbi:MAG TPA: tRNA uridine-5-carboxymethylaminomethyl(34) synthesis GTPase MnmE [Alphaproteobacteria bacterium]|nr:tRNA uridine-5-carboxymethylaminomethyl(34) synthesis GTPase MnmE [Alphaproteobacteria bacterium]
MLSTDDTIVALATAPLPAGLAVIRLSGPLAWTAAEALTGSLANIAPRQVAVRDFSFRGEVIDNGLVVGFRAPRSFTGEDVVELQTHGSLSVVQTLLDILTGIEGVRQAGPGEFTRRAVLNGKMDITAAEGLADLIAASTAAQRRQALRQLDGALGERFEHWRNRIMATLAQVEAAIDFPDEELEVLAVPQLATDIRAIADDLQQALGERAGERVREGLRLAIVGKPNAGKSTLINLLSGREVAIVSPTAGTTRDVVTSALDIGGYPVTLADTAGLRVTDEEIEAEGVRRARAQAQSADVVVGVVDARDYPDLNADVAGALAEAPGLLVVSHADMVDDDFPDAMDLDGVTVPVLAADLRDRAALPRLLQGLEKIITQVAGAASEAALLTRERHRTAVSEALAHLGHALVLIAQAQADSEGSKAELAAEDLRAAAAAIGKVTGRVSSEDVLDVVFSTFCIGK